MRNSRTCTLSVALIILLLCVGLYLTLEAWAVEKSQADGQLSLVRAEAAKLVSTLDGKLKDSTEQQQKLLAQIGDLTSQLSKKDGVLVSATSQLNQLQQDLARLKSQGAGGEQAQEVEELKKQLKSLQAKIEESPASGPGKGQLVDVTPQAWQDMAKVPVWVWWEFPRGVPTGIRLNVRTWMRHIPADRFQLNFVNMTNIKTFIPDLPDAFYRLYPLAQSDFVRAAMIALHGGVYMDGDMMLRNDLDKVFPELVAGTTDVTPYLWEHQECRKSFSTNFMGGIKGNALSAEWLRRIYKLLFSECPNSINNGDDGMYDYFTYRGCCYKPGWEPRSRCYVSFGAFGDKSAHGVMEDIIDKGPNKRPLRMTCIDKWKGMAANASGSGGELLWKKLLPGPPDGYEGPIGPWSKVPKREQRAEMCWREGPADLRCTQSGLYPGFMERHGYHLFNLNNNDLLSGFHTEQELMDSGSVAGTLYKIALEGEQPNDPRLKEINLKPAKLSDSEHARTRMWGDTRQWKMPWLRNN